MTRTHRLKTHPSYFKAVWHGLKPFEVRLNDRHFQVGDYLLLEEWDPETEAHTGYVMHKRISYLLDDPAYCKEGYVIMGMADGARGREAPGLIGD